MNPTQAPLRGHRLLPLQAPLRRHIRRGLCHVCGPLPVGERFLERVLGLGRRGRRHVQQTQAEEALHLEVRRETHGCSMF